MQKWVTGYTHCQADKISKNKDNFIKTWSELFVIQLNNNGKEWIICHSFIKHNRSPGGKSFVGQCDSLSRAIEIHVAHAEKTASFNS